MLQDFIISFIVFYSIKDSNLGLDKLSSHQTRFTKKIKNNLRSDLLQIDFADWVVFEAIVENLEDQSCNKIVV